MDQKLEDLKNILEKGSIAQTSIIAASDIVIKASILDISKMMDLIYTTLQKFLDEKVSGKKILSIFYVCNDLVYRGKNNDNKVIQLEFEKIFPKIIDSMAVTKFPDSCVDQLQSIKNVLKIWQDRNLVDEINVKKLAQILKEKKEEIQKNREPKEDFEFAVEDLIILSERLNKQKEWRKNRKTIKSKIQELEKEDNNQEEKEKSQIHLKKCDETLQEVHKKIQSARKDYKKINDKFE